MKCELCNSAEASVHFKQVVDGDVRELYVCQECAAKNGFDVQSPMALTDFLFGMGLSEDESDPASEKTCPSCGMTLNQFRKMSRLGCARCYETFSEQLEPYLLAMHRSTRHSGKMPAGEKLTSEIVAMQKAMEKAVSCEDFEEAAKLRDALHALKANAAKDIAGEGEQ